MLTEHFNIARWNKAKGNYIVFFIVKRAFQLQGVPCENILTAAS